MLMTKGVGIHKEKLTSIEMALRRAGIAQFNLVRVSSIYPPRCRIIKRPEGIRHLRPGQVVHTVMSEVSTNEPHRLISASIGIAIPKDPEQYGYLSEHHAFGQTEEVAGDYAEDLAASMLATILGLDFDPNSNYDEKKEVWRISGKIIKTSHITQSAIGNKFGLWTTCIAAAVLIP
jgi:arginine decarboxylase